MREPGACRQAGWQASRWAGIEPLKALTQACHRN
jgi:hypothetical protein